MLDPPLGKATRRSASACSPRSSPRLYTIARRLVGDEAEDAVQDALLKAYRAFDRLEHASAGAGDPYGSLRKALRADIDEAAWASLYRTESRPFPAPETGKIAVKVINHYGDEVMKVYELAAETPSASQKRASSTERMG